jgi:hypothetical protein
MDVETKVLSLINRIQVGHSLTPDTSQEVIDVDALDIVIETNISPTQRRGERLKVCCEALAQWRDRVWHHNYGLCAWGPNVLLAETVIAKLTMTASLSSLEDVKHEVPDWVFANKYGTDVIDVIKAADELWKRGHEQEIQTRKQNHRHQSQENKELCEEQ